jgi:predicted alpha-1,2-mannosidase
MNNRFILSLLFFPWLTLCAANDPVDFVDPFICTLGDHGHWDPSALAPHGLVKLGPDTWPGSLTGHGDLAHSGYDYADSHIRGLSHFHRGSSGGTTVYDRAGLLSIMPFSANRDSSFFAQPVSRIDKKTEKASPGYYRVQLPDENITLELTATVHCGWHRYSFQKGQAGLFIYQGNRSRSRHISMRVVHPQRIEGVENAGNYNIYFIIEFDQPVRNWQIWDGKQELPGDSLLATPQGGLICHFGAARQKQVLVRVAVSITSLAAAQLNLQSECRHWQFADVHSQTRTQWNKTLSAIQVQGPKEYKTIFYTALYHTCFLPVILTDVDGRYPGLDQRLHQAQGYVHYFDYAFWDSFRTKYPLYSLFAPQVYRDIVQSLRDIYEQADNYLPFPEYDHPAHGPLYNPKGKNGYQPFSTCRHEHMLMVMADAYFKNIFDPDMAAVYPFLRKEALLQMPEKYDAMGYIPARPDQIGEYSWDNWCVAQVARRLNLQEDYNYFLQRSQYWKNSWDPALRFFRARAADGSWLDFPQDPTKNREKYTYEGSKWHFRWNALHDVPAMMQCFGGREAFVKELDYFFQNDLYTAGNQIDLHAPFLFNCAGEAWQTQKWVHKILAEPMVQRYGTHSFFPKPIYDRIYKATPDGYLLEMDDDYGCMAAWYALAAMGLYQICPGQPVYQITSPLFSRVEIRLDDKSYPGHLFVIEAKGLAGGYYIQSAAYYDNQGRFVKVWNQSWIAHQDLVKGGRLVFKMGAEPNREWGVEKSADKE